MVIYHRIKTPTVSPLRVFYSQMERRERGKRNRSDGEEKEDGYRRSETRRR